MVVASFKESLHFTLRTFQFRTRAHLSWAFIPLVSKQQQPSSTVACRRDRTAENAVTTFYPISAEILGLAHGTTPSTQAYHPHLGINSEHLYFPHLPAFVKPLVLKAVSSSQLSASRPLLPRGPTHPTPWQPLAVLQERPGCSLCLHLAVCRDRLIQAHES